MNNSSEFEEVYSNVGPPQDFLTISNSAWKTIIVYMVAFVFSATANIYVLHSVWKTLRSRPTPMNKLILHLSIADLHVVILNIPVEIGWRLSIKWMAGNVMCKVIHFYLAFGLYLSSMVLISISLDRYYSIVHPLKAIDSEQRVKYMIVSSWVSAAIFSLPQFIVFKEEIHPEFKDFRQCMSVWLSELELVNTIFSISAMYFVPLIVIIYCYSRIIYKMSQNSEIIQIIPFLRGSQTVLAIEEQNNTFLRRMGPGKNNVRKARNKTLKLSLLIVIVFIICWTPYVVITLWHMFDRESAKKLDSFLQEMLFITVISNSTFNPLVYHIFTRKKVNRSTNSVKLSNITTEPRRTIN